MIYGSVCSGIEAASVAWEPLGWTPAWFAEIEPFPSAVLAHRYPGVPNHGDFTALLKAPLASVDVLVGGTPCQAFSVAGLRGGLSDPRGNLALAFVSLVDVLRPRWVVWENVPGVLSSGGGNDFGCFLGGLAAIGYGWAYRVLDAQYFGLAQRRARVFVVASPGDWRGPAAVLFEPESVRRDSPPRHRSGAGVAGALGTGASDGGGWRLGADEAAAGQAVPVWSRRQNWPAEVAPTLYAMMGCKQGMENQHIDGGAGHFVPTVSPCLETQVGGLRQPCTQAYVVGAVPASLSKGLGHNKDEFCTPHEAGVRRLTPIECERLQGFPDAYTDIPYRGAPSSPDGPRYKALGNSMAVPVMRWIGQRVAMVDAVPIARDEHAAPSSGTKETT